MSTIILDDCLLYLYEAEKCMNEYKEIDAYMEIFEAEDPEVKEQVMKNEQASAGAMANIKKAAKAVLDMIRKLMKSIRDFIDKRKLSADERAAYEQFKEAMKKDPSLKDKKITVRDFKELDREYNSLLKEIEAEERKAAAGKVGDAKVLGDKVAQFAKNAGKGAVTAVSAETALRLAATSTDVAKLMYNKLEKDEAAYQKLVDEIGEKQAKKVKKDLKSLTYGISLKRMKMQVTRTYSKSWAGAIASMGADMKQIATGIKTGDKKALAKGVIKQQGTLKKMAGNKELGEIDEVVGFAGKVAAKTAVKSAVSDVKDNVKGAINDKAQKAAEKKAEKVAAKAKAKGKEVPKKALNPDNYNVMKKFKRTHKQGIVDAVLGTNDPNNPHAKSKAGKKVIDTAKQAERFAKIIK